MLSSLFHRLAAVLLIAAGAAACTDTAGESETPSLDVVVTTSVLGDLVATLVGDDGRVEVLMGAGQDPHGFALSARQAQALLAADLVVANGLGLEASLVDSLARAEADGVEVLAVAEQVDPQPYAAEIEHGHEDEHEDDHGTLDPHVWYDPVRMATAAEVIAAQLAAVDDRLPDATWVARGEELAQALRATHDEVAATLAAVPEVCRVLVTNHDSFGYFGARYGFDIIGTVVPGTAGQADPSAREFADLVVTVREASVPAIFADTSQSTRLAESLAQEVGFGVSVVELYTDALGPEGSGAETYRGMMRVNAQRIADALASC